MKLNCALLPGFGCSLESGIRKIHEMGFAAIEVVCEHPFFNVNEYSKHEDLLKKLKKELSLEFTVHAPFTCEFYSHVDPVFRKYLHKMVEKSAEFAKNLDSEILVVHGGMIPAINYLFHSRENSVGLFVDELKPLVGKNPDLKICLENLSRPQYIGHTVKECKAILDMIPALGFCWDVPHSFVGGILEDFIKSDLKVDYVHISDSDTIEDRHWPLGRGKVPWKIVKESLDKKGYRGYVVFECRSIQDVAKSREYWNEL